MNTFNSIQRGLLYMPPPTATSAYAFNPNFSGSGMKLWLDANNAGSLTKSGNAVSKWRDLTGNISNISANSTPTYNPTGCNGKPTLTFVAGNQFNTTNSSITNVNFNFFVVFKMPTPSGIPAMFALYNGLTIYPHTPANLLGIGSNIEGVLWTYTGGGPETYKFNNVATPINAFCIVQVSIINNKKTVYINGVPGNQVSCSPGQGGTLIIGNSGNGNNYFVGAISEILVYNNTLTDENRQKIEGYLAWKWGLQASLPNNHLYKTTQVSYAP